MERVTVGREIRFSAAHSLPHVPAGHKCHRLHGHSYRVVVELTGDVQEPTGWVFDFGMLDAVMRQLIFDFLDHQHLNTIPGLENPTSEVLARWIRKRMLLGITTTGVRVSAVTVYEGDGGGWARLEVGEKRAMGRACNGVDCVHGDLPGGRYRDCNGSEWNDPRDMDPAGGR